MILPELVLMICGLVYFWLHSALKMIAVWILHVFVPRPASVEKQKQWANTAAWWIFMNG